MHLAALHNGSLFGPGRCLVQRIWGVSVESGVVLTSMSLRSRLHNRKLFVPRKHGLRRDQGYHGHFESSSTHTTKSQKGALGSPLQGALRLRKIFGAFPFVDLLRTQDPVVPGFHEIDMRAFPLCGSFRIRGALI